jgi:hypothetical protein
MATLDSLQFEMERRVILFKPVTTMPDNSQLGYNADPNLIASPSTPGENLLYYSPNNTRYVNYDASGNTLIEWYKKAQPNGWAPIGGDSSINMFGTESETWQLNIDASGVILKDSSGNLIIENADGQLTNLIIGGLTIGTATGVLRAIDGSVFIDPAAGVLLTGNGVLIGDGTTTDFTITHNINSEDHITSVYELNNNLIYPDISIGLNTDLISFNNAPTENYRVVILGF